MRKKDTKIVREMDECSSEPYPSTQAQQPSFNVSSNVNSDGTKSVSISAQGDAAEDLMYMLRMAGLANGGHKMGGQQTAADVLSDELLLPKKNSHDGECDCNSWDCDVCFPDDDTHAHMTHKDHDHDHDDDVCHSCGHHMASEGHAMSCGMDEENEDGEESPLSYGEENLREDGAEKSVEEMIKNILDAQNLQIGNVDTEYTEDELAELEDEELKKVYDEVMGSVSGVDQGAQEEVPAEEPVPAQPAQPQQPVQPQQPAQAQPDQAVMEWLKRFNKLGK